ncbi:FERM domain-containing protein 3 [Trichinella spiralis]|uniref:FERM domain-containing protein 3 n=1 Tax=Trichinella spiralis TaxID=6334 RepID=UPI0001EFD6F2|nr:FERM domain-containing protein 3 [Trichinella spiralis]
MMLYCRASSFAGIGALVTTLTTSGRRLLTEATIDFIRIVDLSHTMLSRVGSYSTVSKVMRCKVFLLDDNNAIDVEYNKGDTGEQLLNQVCDQLNIAEKDYFGLRFVDKNRVLLDRSNKANNTTSPMKNQTLNTSSLFFRMSPLMSIWNGGKAGVFGDILLFYHRCWTGGSDRTAQMSINNDFIQLCWKLSSPN